MPSAYHPEATKNTLVIIKIFYRSKREKKTEQQPKKYGGKKLTEACICVMWRTFLMDLIHLTYKNYMRRLSPKLTEISQAVRFCSFFFFLFNGRYCGIGGYILTATIPSSMHIVCVIRFRHQVFHVRSRTVESGQEEWLSYLLLLLLIFLFANDRSIFILSFVSFVSFALFGTETVKVDDYHWATHLLWKGGGGWAGQITLCLS